MARLVFTQFLAGLAAAAPEAISGGGFVSLPIQSAHQRTSQLSVRDTPDANLADAKMIHLISLGLGTPPQTVMPAIDTGSYDLWVNPNCTTSPQPMLCNLTLPYNPNSSSTAVALSDPLGLYAYSADGDVQVLVGFVNDTVKIGQSSLPSAKFGVADMSWGVSTGIFGIGPNPDPTIGFSNSSGNGGLVADMVSGGLINSRVYGLALAPSNVTYGSGGTVCFGGVDKNRFTGSMFKLPIISADEAPDGAVRFWVRIQSFGAVAPGQNESTIRIATDYQDAFLDSGTTQTFVPESVFAAMITQVGGEVDDNGQVPVNCSLYDNPPEGGLMFHFDGGSIMMSYSNLIIDIRPLADPGQPGCFLGVAPIADGALPVLGHGFLEAAYAVFDLDNQNIHLAQGAQCGDSDIVPVGAGPDAVPAVAGNCPARSSAANPAASALAQS